MSAVTIKRVSPKEARRVDSILRPFERAGRYLVKHFDELVEEHPDEWVALQDNKVMACSKSRTGLRRKLSARGIPIQTAYVKFLTKKKRVLIL